jgi:hypothetical protein
VVSRASSMSKNTAAIDILLFKLRVTWSVSHIHCNVVLWRARKHKLACVKQASFFNVLLEYIMDDLFE